MSQSAPSAPLFCDHCGAANRSQASFCAVCGQSLRSPAATITIQNTNSTSSNLLQQTLLKQRDLKPANVMMTASGHLYLIDFGIARHFKPGKAKDTSALGSSGYAAPEQYGKAQTTPQTDIYGLGATLHQLLTGHDPADTPFHF